MSGHGAGARRAAAAVPRRLPLRPRAPAGPIPVRGTVCPIPKAAPGAADPETAPLKARCESRLPPAAALPLPGRRVPLAGEPAVRAPCGMYVRGRDLPAGRRRRRSGSPAFGSPERGAGSGAMRPPAVPPPGYGRARVRTGRPADGGRLRQAEAGVAGG